MYVCSLLTGDYKVSTINGNGGEAVAVGTKVVFNSILMFTNCAIVCLLARLVYGSNLSVMGRVENNLHTRG